MANSSNLRAGCKNAKILAESGAAAMSNVEQFAKGGLASYRVCDSQMDWPINFPPSLHYLLMCGEYRMWPTEALCQKWR